MTPTTTEAGDLRALAAEASVLAGYEKRGSSDQATLQTFANVFSALANSADERAGGKDKGVEEIKALDQRLSRAAATVVNKHFLDEEDREAVRAAAWDTGKALRDYAAALECGFTDPLADLVSRFSTALLEKLRAAEAKYGYSDGWLKTDWPDDLRRDIRRHVDKGDPRDVAAYCAFAWHHEWSLALPADERAGAEPVASFPRATGSALKGGWTIDPAYLEKVQAEVEAEGWDTQWEAVQTVLLHAERTLASPQPSDHEAGFRAGVGPNVSVKEMKLSDGRSDFYVSVQCNGREVTPHKFSERWKAEYEAAFYAWVFDGGEEPDLMAYGEDEWPARAIKPPSPVDGKDKVEGADLAERIDRLMAAVEGECDGLAIDDQQARAILYHVDTGEDPAEAPSPSEAKVP